MTSKRKIIFTAGAKGGSGKRASSSPPPSGGWLKAAGFPLSGKDTFAWFDDMYDPLKDSSIKFLAVGLVTSEAATVDTVLTWAKTLKNRVDYLIVRNKRNGSDFRYLEKSDPGQQFLKLAKPALIDMDARAPDIQEELGNRGLSLRQALEAPPEVAGPVLSTFSSKARMRGYVMRIDAEFKRIIDVLLP